LIQTLSTASLSPGHSGAACNAISAFIDAAAKSQCETTKQFIHSQEVWLTIFDIGLSLYEDSKPKPMKLILTSITALLAKGHQGASRSAIQATVIDTIVPNIVLGEPQSRLKGSLVFLEAFIRRDAILPTEFIPLLREWLSRNKEKWSSRFAKDREVLSPGETEPISDITSGKLSDELAAKIFVLGLLAQINNKAVAVPAGNMLATFIQTMKAETSPEKLSEMWVIPARRLILEQVETLEDLSNRLLEPLFTVDPNGFKTFLETLPVKSLLDGDMTDAPEADYMVLFAALQVGKKINLVHEDCE
jgi:hypothetical protein